ncbi:MAG: glycosyltransferase family 4 protein, partial [Thermoanaerobaculales bacterium]
MVRRVRTTIAFFAGIARDLAGTLRDRWRTFNARVAGGEAVATVGVDIYPFFERMTGVGWYEWHLLAALDRRDDGISYNLYARTFLAPDDPAPPEMPGRNNMRLRVHQIPSGFLLPVKPTLKTLRTVVAPLLRTFDGNNVLFAPNFFLHGDQEPFGRAQVATVHDLAFFDMPSAVSPQTLDGLARHLPRTLFHSDRLIAVSDATAADLREHLGVARRRVTTIHEGVDPEFAQAGRTKPPEGLPETYLLFVSTLEPRKNVEGVLRAFRLLAEWGYRGDLVMVGRWGWRTDTIRHELESSPVLHRIHHLDYVERSRLAALYCHADALLFPSWMEGFGLPILESMACGTPVITSGTSAMPEVGGPAAIYVDPASPHSIASATSALLGDPGHRKRLVALGHERVTRFSWDAAAAATAQVLRQAAG